MRLMMLFIAVFLTATGPADARGAENCTVCHRITLAGKHGALPCLSCHGSEARPSPNPASFADKAAGCTTCHRGYGGMAGHVMATRSGELGFVQRTYGQHAPTFFTKNCGECHVRSCLDCHGSNGHKIVRPALNVCLTCHKGYFTGAEYAGRAPREEHERYQRGVDFQGEPYLKMLPDVHFEKGLTCAACHDMASFLAGRKSAKRCTGCHQPSRKVLEHRIAAHLVKMECYACHSAWAPQEYGTFYLRFTDSTDQNLYRLRDNNGVYVKSVYLKKQDAPPLGVNGRGMVSPVRPEFIAYYTHVRNDRLEGVENRLLAAEWRAFFPHTVRRGTPMCDGCHDNRRRFLLEKPEERIYRLREDGMSLDSFWDRTGQRVVNGSFLDAGRYQEMAARKPAYTKGYVEKWKSLVNRVDSSSSR